jgi:hypothetical protein
VNPDLVVSGLEGAGPGLLLEGGGWVVPRTLDTAVAIFHASRRDVVVPALPRTFRDEQELKVFRPKAAGNRVYVRWVGAEVQDIASLAVDRVVAVDVQNRRIDWVSDLVPWMNTDVEGGVRDESTIVPCGPALACLSYRGTLLHLNAQTGEAVRIADLPWFKASAIGQVDGEPYFAGLRAESSDTYLGYGGPIELRAFGCRAGEPLGAVPIADAKGFAFDRPLVHLDQRNLVVACTRKHAEDAIGSEGRLRRESGAPAGDRVVAADLVKGELLLDGSFPGHIVSQPLAKDGALWFFAFSHTTHATTLIRMSWDGRWERASADIPLLLAVKCQTFWHQEALLASADGGLIRVKPGAASRAEWMWKGTPGPLDLLGDDLLLTHYDAGRVLRFNLRGPGGAPPQDIAASWGDPAPDTGGLFASEIFIAGTPPLLGCDESPPAWVVWKKKLVAHSVDRKGKPRDVTPAPFGPAGRGWAFRHLLRSARPGVFGMVFEKNGEERELWMARRSSGGDVDVRQVEAPLGEEPGNRVPLCMDPAAEMVLFGQKGEGLALLDVHGKTTTVDVPGRVVSAVSPAPGCFAVLAEDASGDLRPFLLKKGSGAPIQLPQQDRFASLCVSASGRLFHVSQAVAGYPGLVILELDPRTGRELARLEAPDVDLVTPDGETFRTLYPDPAGARFACLDEQGSPHRLLLLGADGRLTGDLDLQFEVEEPLVWSPDGQALAVWYDEGLLTVSLEPQIPPGRG